ncbi:DUF6624 domain-containing protein [Caulobacter vibrioides]|uniref:DUF6624 domain-containing protein n=1 Tax=Caulobacter vibrioides TaxID=155892 RepID=UPI000BB4FFF9|nr:DUF6624 domain-containing protein [Caulobacter vibrioides]ATC24834.1 hypothetical protein CA608_10040 [Caulobacter vibrioides]PLR09611.1 hypothetical protein CVUC_15460 [Caulobacter vibrioides]
MIGILLVALLSASDTPPLGPRAAELIAPVRQALDAERKTQAALPPPANDSEKLERMGRLDQVGRRVLTQIDLSVLPPEELKAARKAIWAPIEEADAENERALLAMVPPEGWFLKSRYGDRAAKAAFNIVQHSNLDLWRRFVPVLEPLVAKGEVDGQSYGLMYDRLALNEGRPQRYGSQMVCKDGRYVVDTLEAPEAVDERRKAMGFLTPLAEYVATFAKYPPCN